MNLLIQESPFFLLPTLAKRIGVNEALFLQQLHFWLKYSNTESMGCKWVFNSANQWQEQFPFWSTRTIERIVQSLKKKKVIVTVRLRASQNNQTNFYTINYQCELLKDIAETDKLAVSQTDMMSESDTDKVAVSSIQTSLSVDTKDASIKNVANLYNEILGDYLPMAKSINNHRASSLKARQKEYPKALDIEWWELFFESVKSKPFLLGKNDSGWMANLDYLLSPRGFTKIIEGQY